MNSTIETIMNRRSIRFFENREIPRSDLETIIEAGNCAPTGSGRDWRFTVVSSKKLIKELSETAVPAYEGFMTQAPEHFREIRRQIDAVTDDPIYYNAPAVIFVISGAMTASSDCPMVCQNMMLSASSMGIGSCWVYFGQIASEQEKFKEVLNLQEGESVFGPIILGYPSDNQPPAAPLKTAQVEWN